MKPPGPLPRMYRDMHGLDFKNCAAMQLLSGLLAGESFPYRRQYGLPVKKQRLSVFESDSRRAVRTDSPSSPGQIEGAERSPAAPRDM